MSEVNNTRVLGTLYAPLVALSAPGLMDPEYQLSDEVHLVRPPRALLDKRQEEWFGEEALDEIRSAEFWLTFKYEADLKTHLGERERNAADAITHATAALWIARPMCAGAPYLLFYRDDSGDNTPHTVERSHSMLRPLPEHGDNELGLDDIQTLKVIVPRIMSMRRDDNAVTRAIRYQVAALHSWHAYPRLAMMTAAIEALFTTDSSEVAHKVSERIAFLLEAQPGPRWDLFRQVKSIYKLRSSVVHGAGLGSLDIAEVALRGAALESLASRCLRTVLVSDELSTAFAGRQERREDFLNRLLFS